MQSDRKVGDPADPARLAAFEHAEHSPHEEESRQDAGEPQGKLGQAEQGNGNLRKERIQDVIGGVVEGPQTGPRPVDEIQEREGLVVNDGLMRGAPGAHGGPREREGDGQQVLRGASRKLRSLSVPKGDRRSSPLSHRGKHLRVVMALKAKGLLPAEDPDVLSKQPIKQLIQEATWRKHPVIIKTN